MKFFLSLAGVLVFLFLALFQIDKALTQDLGRHLALGKMILSCHCVPHTNVFSYTNPDFPFVNHHWFSEVIFYLTVSAGGFSFLLWLKILVILFSFSLIFFIAYKKSSLFWATTLSLPYILVLSERFDTRPEIFSFLFLSLILFFIFLYKNSKKIWPLLCIPLIELFWVNMHIYFLVGLGIFFLCIVSEYIGQKKNFDVKLLGVFFLSLIAICINPYGVEGALYPFTVFGNYGYTIVENQNIFFLNSFFFNYRVLIVEFLTILLVLGVIIQNKKSDYFWLFSSLFAVVAGYMMIRNLPLFVFITFPYLSSLCFKLVKDLEQKKKNEAVRMINGGALFITLCIVIFFLRGFMMSPFKHLTYIDIANGGALFLKENKPQGKIFNNFDIGSYLIYQLYPEYKVFVDGRPEAYPAHFFDEYKKMQTDKSYFEKKTKEYGINTIFFTRNDITPWAREFFSWLPSDKNWSPVFADSYVIVFVRNTSQNASMIEKYKLNSLR